MIHLRLIDAIEAGCVEHGIPFEAVRTAGDLMRTDVKTLTLDDTVKTSLDLMQACRIRHVPVLDMPRDGEDKPVFIGVISQRDVLRLKTPDAGAADKDDPCPKALRQLLARVVTRDPVTVGPLTPIREAITLQIGNHIDMLPVLQQETLVGLITATDFLRLLTKVGKHLAEAVARQNGDLTAAEGASAQLRTLSARTVQDCMVRQVVCLTEQDTLTRAIELLKKQRFRHLPILDEGNRLAGIVSDRDILRHLPYAGPRPPRTSREFRADLFRVGPRTRNLDLRMADVMTRNVHAVSPDTGIFDAAETLLRQKVSCLPVLDADRTVCGILTQTDLLRLLSTIYEGPAAAGPVPRQARVPSRR